MEENSGITTEVALMKQEISHLRETVEATKSQFQREIDEDHAKIETLEREIGKLRRFRDWMLGAALLIGFTFNFMREAVLKYIRGET